MMPPLGWNTGNPEPISSGKLNRSSSAPSLRWSRRAASSSIRRYASRASRVRQAVPYTRWSWGLASLPRQYAAAVRMGLIAAGAVGAASRGDAAAGLLPARQVRLEGVAGGPGRAALPGGRGLGVPAPPGRRAGAHELERAGVDQLGGGQVRPPAQVRPADLAGLRVG